MSSSGEEGKEDNELTAETLVAAVLFSLLFPTSFSARYGDYLLSPPALSSPPISARAEKSFH